MTIKNTNKLDEVLKFLHIIPMQCLSERYSYIHFWWKVHFLCFVNGSSVFKLRYFFPIFWLFFISKNMIFVGDKISLVHLFIILFDKILQSLDSLACNKQKQSLIFNRNSKQNWNQCINHQWMVQSIKYKAKRIRKCRDILKKWRYKR